VFPDVPNPLRTQITFDKLARDVAARGELSIEQDAKVVDAGDAVPDEGADETLQVATQPAAASEFDHCRGRVGVGGAARGVFGLQEVEHLPDLIGREYVLRVEVHATDGVDCHDPEHPRANLAAGEFEQSGDLVDVLRVGDDGDGRHVAVLDRESGRLERLGEAAGDAAEYVVRGLQAVDTDAEAGDADARQLIEEFGMIGQDDAVGLDVRRSVQLQKRYKDKADGKWKTANTYFPEDLPRIQLALAKAYEWIMTQPRDAAEDDATETEDVPI